MRAAFGPERAAFGAVEPVDRDQRAIVGDIAENGPRPRHIRIVLPDQVDRHLARLARPLAAIPAAATPTGKGEERHAGDSRRLPSHMLQHSARSLSLVLVVAVG